VADEPKDWDGEGSPMVDPLTAWGAVQGSREGSKPDVPEDKQISPLILLVLLGLPVALLVLVAVISK
jgi:hypothetical protein